jgi:hypothetical protein
MPMYAIPAQAAGFVSLMGRIEKGSGDALDLPEGLINIGGNGKGYVLEAKTDWDPNENNDGSFSSLSLGDDVYIYAVQGDDGKADWIASANSTYPDGHTESDSRKVGGFHFGRVRETSQAYDSAATLSEQIVPNSVWDLQHRPTCDPTGMVEIIPGRLWADIYLASEGPGSWPDTVPESRYDATPLSGTEGYSQLDYSRLVRNAGKRLPDYSEFLMFAYGVPQGASGGSGRQNTGDHYGYGIGVECVSCLNVDQPSGNLYQQTSHYFDRSTLLAWYNDLNEGKDSAENHGQWGGGEFRTALVGGSGPETAESGARCVILASYPPEVVSNAGLRAVCDSL